jgi:16S rRNA (guanine966-N2)-methyltransferase
VRVRVIAGRYGGRRLKAPRGRTTRPTSDRVREALFSMLGDVGDARVLDVFAGTGALGIEALSRGAARAVFIERDAAALAALGRNLQELQLHAPAAEVRRGEARAALGAAQARGETYDLIFIDPPYGDAQAWERELPALLEPLLARAARVVVESDRRARLRPAFAGSSAARERRHGDTTITIYTTNEG